MSRSPNGIVYRLALRGSARSSLTWGAFFAFVGFAVVTTYEEAYRSAAERAAIALLIEGNKAFEALFGIAVAIDTPGGFANWRAGGPILIFAGVVGLLASTRLLRGEEEAGRWEQLVAGAIAPGRATLVTLAGYATSVLALGLLTAGGFVAAGLPPAGAAIMGATVALVTAAFAALGALASQLVPSRRRAAGLAGTVFALFLLLRVLADGTDTLGVLRPFTPFGWAELVRPFSDARPAWLIPLALWTILLAAAAVVLAGRRDLHGGWIAEEDARASSMRLLGSPAGHALRTSVRPVIVWAIGVGAFATVLGLLAADIVSFLETSEAIRRFAAGLGALGFGGAVGFLGVVFTFLAVPASLVALFRLAAAREEETSARLDLVLAGSVRRPVWLLGWVGVALAAALAVVLVAGIAAWIATVSRGGDVSLGQTIAGGLNVLPAVATFVGLGVLLFGLLPRWSTGLTLGAIGAAQVLSLLAAQDAVPGWVGQLSPFSHVAPVPAVEADLAGAVGLLLVGATLTLVGTVAFARRDLAGA